MTLKMMDASSSSNLIQEAGSVLRLEEHTLELAARLEVSNPSDGTGVLVLKLASTGNGWPAGYRLAGIGFRPQSASYYFNYIDLDPWGNPTRITRQSASTPHIEKEPNSMEVRFRILRLVAAKPYEVLVTLRDATGRIHRMGVPSVGQN